MVRGFLLASGCLHSRCHPFHPKVGRDSNTSCAVEECFLCVSCFVNRDNEKSSFFSPLSVLFIDFSPCPLEGAGTHVTEPRWKQYPGIFRSHPNGRAPDGGTNLASLPICEPLNVLTRLKGSPNSHSGIPQHRFEPIFREVFTTVDGGNNWKRRHLPRDLALTGQKEHRFGVVGAGYAFRWGFCLEEEITSFYGSSSCL